MHPELGIVLAYFFIFVVGPSIGGWIFVNEIVTSRRRRREMDADPVKYFKVVGICRRQGKFWQKPYQVWIRYGTNSDLLIQQLRTLFDLHTSKAHVQNLSLHLEVHQLTRMEYEKLKG